VRVSVSRAGACVAALYLAFLVLAAAPAHAQAPLPGNGFVPPYEIMRTVRAAGFDPLAPPLRQGATYVLRATDFRGILMRVVVDAHSGAIRDVNRIVAGPSPAGQVGLASPPHYGSPFYGSPPCGAPSAYGPPEFDAPDLAPNEESAAPPASPPTVAHTPPSAAPLPPLPRPRPAQLAARRSTAKGKAGAKPNGNDSPKVGGAADLKSDDAPAPAAPGKAETSAPLND
jgi:hypothetical protein